MSGIERPFGTRAKIIGDQKAQEKALAEQQEKVAKAQHEKNRKDITQFTFAVACKECDNAKDIKEASENLYTWIFQSGEWNQVMKRFNLFKIMYSSKEIKSVDAMNTIENFEGLFK